MDVLIWAVLLPVYLTAAAVVYRLRGHAGALPVGARALWGITWAAPLLLMGEWVGAVAFALGAVLGLILTGHGAVGVVIRAPNLIGDQAVRPWEVGQLPMQERFGWPVWKPVPYQALWTFQQKRLWILAQGAAIGAGRHLLIVLVVGAVAVTAEALALPIDLWTTSTFGFALPAGLTEAMAGAYVMGAGAAGIFVLLGLVAYPLGVVLGNTLSPTWAGPFKEKPFIAPIVSNEIYHGALHALALIAALTFEGGL